MGTDDMFTNKQKLFSLLELYYPKTSPISNALIKANPFYGQYVPAAYANAGTANFSNIVPKLGNLDVTTISDGLAQFLVERTKEELNAAFFEKFKETMKKFPEFKIF